ncbi:BgTH12-05892 [Blumeria graminis f. sp. triticale]|uniref:Bgt-20619 n=3 Tax=Blumeria graminis TaxID=34373 RepID=A0A9X9QEF4_BLUGR|nr:BgTH12-05892 [Blumeria graminis f. sp. triticale]VDB90926.1 Bgt-20619 [Blumeria graminis f. sp. tritici]
MYSTRTNFPILKVQTFLILIGASILKGDQKKAWSHLLSEKKTYQGLMA